MWEVQERDASENEREEHESAAPDGLRDVVGTSVEWEEEVEEFFNL